jgi:cellobiose phosphorylase
MDYTFGHFSGDGSEFIVTNPQTPRAFDNYLWNDALFAIVQQTGVGCCDYQIGPTEPVQLFSGMANATGGDAFGREHLMSRLIYVRDRDSGAFWNVNWEPVCRKPEAWQCTHGPGYSVIASTTDGIESRFRVFVPTGSDPVELWTLDIRNVSGRKRRLSLFLYNQFQFRFKWNFDSYGAMIFRSAELAPEHNAVVVRKHPHRRPHDFLTAFLTADLAPVAYDGCRDAFVGLYHTLQAPAAVVRGRCSNTPGSAEATIGALQFDLDFDASGARQINLVLGATDDTARIPDFRSRYLGHIEDHFAALREEKAALIARNRVHTPDAHFDRMLNLWVKQGTLYGATWCRWGWLGYRDVVQHGFGVTTFKPQRTKAILLDAFRYQYQSGLALRGWNPVNEKPYSDSALWLVFTLIAYLRETGEQSLLDARVPFYDGGEDSVRGHIDRALDFLENNKGAHGLILIKFGDWNDSLTAVGKEGRGESVWLSQAYAEAMRQMAALAEYQQDAARQKDYLGRYQRIKDSINQHAWDGAWYTRCFDDAGRPVGSHHNTQAKIFIEAQTWALIAGIADEARTKQLLTSCDELLLTDVGYALLAPSFHSPDDNIGRISCMEPGTCENGTIYSHTNVWMVLGLLRAGLTEKAFDILRRITPGYVTGAAADPKQNCPPYMYANCYYGPEHRNNPFQMEYTWITGSVAWFNDVLLQHLIGARADFAGLRLDPRLPAAWDHCEVERHFRGATYRIVIENPKHLSAGRPQITLDGQLLDGNLLPLCPAGTVHQVHVVLQAQG